jgi:dihydrodipicolinate reductase
MKVSDVTLQNVMDFLRIDFPTEIERSEISAMMTAAQNYIVGYTGLTPEEIDEHEDITLAYQVLIADMFDNRNNQIEKPTYVNRTVQSILSLHRTNLV